jgi:hydroxymethylpyrimidine pyrophosphatase-like HAD family hydrolase
MHRRVLAFDFDGTLAENGIVPPALQAALERLRSMGYILFLATGRRYESVEFGLFGNLFAGIVWENGAVLYHTATEEIYLPFGAVDPRLKEALIAAGVPLESGLAIASTWTPHEEKVWRVLNDWGGEAVVAYNKGAVMILPAGTSKGTGLERLLGLCGYSPRNLVAFGDGENDLSLLELGEFGVTVADGVSSLKAIADLVTTRPGPAGVLEVCEVYWLNGFTPSIPLRRERQILLGQDETGNPVYLPGAALSGGNLGVFGDSGSGKSWVTGLLAEGMQHAGYQSLLIDPEGDFKGLRALPGIVALEGNEKSLPAPALVVALVEMGNVTVVLDMCSYRVNHRIEYVADLLRALRSLRERKFRPHWIVLEEAQYFLPPNGGTVATELAPMLAGGGWAFVSYRPDRLDNLVLERLNNCLLTRLTEPEAVRTVCRVAGHSLGEESPANINRGYAWLCGQRLVRLHPNARRIPHIRHLYKYLDKPLPAHKRFNFRDEHDFLCLEAASLFEFLQILPSLPLKSLAYHQARDDFAKWAEGALGDSGLAAHLHKLAHRKLHGEALREALLQRVASHYQELQALR